MLVVEGLLTDQPEVQTVKISRSLPVGQKTVKRPLSGCTVTIIDDLDIRTRYTETDSGIYVSPVGFHGELGRTYRVHIAAPAEGGIYNYDSKPAVMLPVPAIDTLYYEKSKVRDEDFDQFDIETCQIYLDTYGNDNGFFRWEYFETWILRLNFSVPDQICWINERSRNIMIKSTDASGETFIKRQPVTNISNVTDRLQTKYSILVNQYSMNEEEYNFWLAMQKITEESGGLYDAVPASVPGNITCTEFPDQTVLGYFSVSAKASKRIFIDENFAGIIDHYADCITDTVYGDGPIKGLDTTVWILFDKPMSFPRPHTRILTETWGCYSCTARGTKERPSFWEGE